MKEKNYALIFKKGAYETCSYIFDEVVIFEDDCIINKSKYNTNGKKIPKEIIHEINKEVVTKIITQNHSIDCSFKINEFNLEALKQYNYFALKIPNLVCSSFVYFFNSSFNKNSFDKAIPIYLYAIGQTINNMDRHDREFKIKTKNTNFMEFFFKKLGNEEVIRNIHKSMIIKNNHFSQNEEIRKSNNIPIQKTNKELGKVDISSINPDDVIEKIKEKIIGQDQAIIDVVDTLFINQSLIDMNDKDALTTGKANILIDGPTGTGKTMLIKEISQTLSLPMTIVSSTSFSTTGYKGADLESILIKLLDEANGDIALAERGIIAFDEFDKLGSKSNQDELLMRKALQEELLTYLSGAKFNINYKGEFIEFDTSKITFIGLGAFTRLREEKIVEKEINKKPSVGFSSTSSNDDNNSRTYEITVDDYIKEGLHRELVGRFTTLTYTSALTIEDYKNIMFNSSVSPLKTLEKLVNNYNKILTYDDDVLSYIAEITSKMNTGARGLQTVFNPIQRALLRQIRSKEISTVELTIDLVKNLQNTKVRSY